MGLSQEAPYNHLIDERGGGLIGIIVWTTGDLIICIICIGISLGLFQNLFELKLSLIFIQPSNKFKWMFKPSNINGIIAIVGSFIPFGELEIDIYIALKIGGLFKYINLFNLKN